MSEFKVFADAVKARFDAMQVANTELFVVEAPDLFDFYLESFPAGTNPIFRVRTEHDGSYDKNFIRNIGVIVAIQASEGINNPIQTIWDIEGLPFPYDIVSLRMAEHVRSLPIKSVFRSKEFKYGNKPNVEVKDGVTTRFTHFYSEVPTKFRTNDPATVRGQLETTMHVLRRGVEELTADSFETVRDLIASNALYRGAEHARALNEFHRLHVAYPRTGNDVDKAVFLWSQLNNPAARFRNTVIGTLLVDLSDGVDIEKAVRAFESKVAPQNYKRTTALITPKMIEGAVGKLRELGLESAVERRFARLSDVSVNNVLFVDNSVISKMKGGLEDLLMEAVRPGNVDIKHSEDITIDKFLNDVLPRAASIDLLVENKHKGNFVSLTAPVHDDAGQLFKWDNQFAWSYDGDVTDSIKDRVKSAGGKVDAPLRISLGWFNTDDLDLSVITPAGELIYYGNKADAYRTGRLDVDMNVSNVVRDAVENIYFERPQDGTYQVRVHNFNQRETVDFGFVLEVECRQTGYVQQFRMEQALRHKNNLVAMNITVLNGVITQVEASSALSTEGVSTEKWGIRTEQLVPVNTLMTSPNHWDGQEIGNKHWFFILKDCINPLPARGIYNEFLKGALDPHRKVFEVLGAKSKCPVTQDQLSGLGFSSTRQDKAKVIVKGAGINKAFNIHF